MADDVGPVPGAEPDALTGRVGDVVGRVFEASQFGMPTEDPRSALEVMWASFEALVAAHFPGPDRGAPADPGVGDATHWSRVLVTAVTNTVLLGGGFVRPADVVAGAGELLAAGTAEGWWQTRRAVGPGALVLRAHTELQALQRSLDAERAPGPDEDAALRRLAAVAALGAALAEAGTAASPRTAGGATGVAEGLASASAADGVPAAMAEAFGIPGVELVPVRRSGWACAICGCLFTGRVEEGVAYPDRYAPVGRHGPCDAVAPCVCHTAPIQRRVGPDGA